MSNSPTSPLLSGSPNFSTVEFCAVGKRFPGVVALDDVSLAIAGGEVHAVIGENGAGKSTLMKLLSGLHRPTSGEIRLFGQAVRFRTPHDAQAAGVAMIHQELNLVDELSVAENIFLGREKTRLGVIRAGWQEAEAARLLKQLNCLTVEPSIWSGQLSIAQKQMVEIAKALSCGARVLIMDEPTAVLSGREIDALFAIIRDLKQQGVTVVYISHLLEEVLAISDRISVLRDGRLVTTLEGAGRKAATPAVLAGLMVGRPMDQYFPPRLPHSGHPVLEVRNLSVPGRVEGVSLSVSRGEIVGLAGLIGAGRTELGEAIAGLRLKSTGEVWLEGTPVDLRSPHAVAGVGIAYLSEDRKGLGLVLGMSVADNMILPGLTLGRFQRWGWVKSGEVAAAAVGRVQSLGIRTAGLDVPVENLSGGNQQKVAVARWLETNPKVLIVDEPTRGVDIGAKEQIYRTIQGLAAAGMACIVISSELAEVLGLCHRIGVMREGRLAGVLDVAGGTVSEEDIMRIATGATQVAEVSTTATTGSVTHG